MSKRHRDMRWRREDGQYIPPDIENSCQLLQVINTGLATHNQVKIIVWPKSIKSAYWSIETPAISLTVRPRHVRLIVERELIQLYNMSSGEFLGQHALGTLEGDIIIGYDDPNQLGLDA